jgi:hypothetical protein
MKVSVWRMNLLLAGTIVSTLFFAACTRNCCTHTIHGTVCDFNGDPLPGTVLSLEDTGIEAITDTSGHFFLRIPERFLSVLSSLTLRVGLAGSVLAEVTYPWRDWPELKITIPSPHVLLYSRTWAPPLWSFWSFPNTTVHLRPDSSIMDQLEGLRVFCQVGDVIHAYVLSAMEGGVISIGVPAMEDEVMHFGSPAIEDGELVFRSSFDHFTLIWSLPGITDQMVELQLANGEDTCIVLKPMDSGSSLAITPAEVLPSESTWIEVCDLTENEWLAPGYCVEERILDPCIFGSDSLWYLGFVRCGAYWDNVRGEYQWRIVLVFHDHLISISEEAQPVSIPFEHDIFMAVLSPDGHQVMVFENVDAELRMESAVLIDIEEGSSYRFVPVACEANVHHRYYDDMSVRIQYPWYNYLLLNSGRIIAHVDDNTLLYTPIDFGEGCLDIDTVDATLWPLGAVDGSELLAEIDENNLCSRIWFFDSLGARECASFDPFPWRKPPEYDRISRRALAESGIGPGLSMYEIPSGNHLLDFPDTDGAQSIALSPGGEFFAWRDSEYRYCTVSRSDRPGVPLVRFRGSSEDSRVNLPVAIASSGSTLWEMQHIEDDMDSWLYLRRRYMLTSQEGDLLWISPSLCFYLRYFGEKCRWWPWDGISCSDCYSMSPDGYSFTWTDNRLIYINRIELVDECSSTDLRE